MGSGLMRSSFSHLVRFVVAAAMTWGSVGAIALPTLKTIEAVHGLSQAEASRGYPVHVFGIITYYDPYLNYPRRPIIMVTDKTSTIYVAIDQQATSPLEAGDMVEVLGRSGPGDFAPTISQARLKILGKKRLPANPHRESLAHLLSGTEDAPWVELEGVVRTVEFAGSNVTLKLALRDGEIAATTVMEPRQDYESLVDAKVTIRGVAGSLFNHRSQIIGVQLLFPNVSALTVETSPPSKPFEAPIREIDRLMTYDPGKVFLHRMHIRGDVTLFWPGRLLCLQDRSGGVCAETDQTIPLQTGQLVDVLGFPEIGNVIPTLHDATFKPGVDVHTVTFAPIGGDQAISGEYDGRLVQVDGTLVTHDRAAQDPTIIVSSGKYNFPVILPQSKGAQKLTGLKEGSKLRITGIVSLQADARVFTRHDGYPVAKYFRILLRSNADVVVTKAPSWWDTEHTLRVLAVVLIATLLTLGWSTILRKRIKRQAGELQYRATHDGLTGVWNRTALLELLDRACEEAFRSGGRIGLIMLDADHFKQINDEYGHPVGDLVLQELAARIRLSIRAGDLVGRYGGEEFLIVLKDCVDAGVLAWAERICSIVADEPIRSGEISLHVTVSGGAAVIEPMIHSAREVLAAADKALYLAKGAGRNRAILAEPTRAACLL